MAAHPDTPAMKVNEGDQIVAFDETLKVIHSGPDRLSSASGSASNWLLIGYAPGRPTRSIICNPELDFTVLRGAR